MSGYMIFWSQDHVKKLKKAGDVIFPVALEKEQFV
jgi:hypothetical protein